MADTGATVRLLHITDTHLWPQDVPPPRFVIPIDGHDPAPWSAIWRLVERESPDAVLWTGDVATAQSREAYDLANGQLEPEAGNLGVVRRHRTGVPVVVVPGNHDHYVVNDGWVAYRPGAAMYEQRFGSSRATVVFRRLRGRDCFFFCLDSSAGINVAESLALAPGRLRKADVPVVESWMDVARHGGHLDGEDVTPERLLAATNVLLLHHDLTSKVLFHELDSGSTALLLKLLAVLPVHLLACGHIHEARRGTTFELVGRGRLDARQQRALRREGLLRAGSVQVSRPGTASQHGAGAHGVHLIEVGASVSIKYLRFDGQSFVP